MKRVKRRKAKNRSTKRTVSGKTDFARSKKTSVLQNLFSSKNLSCKEKDNALRFPNTTLTHIEPPANDKELRRASSKSIRLSRKCDLLQMRQGRIEDEDKYAIMPKVEMPINDIVSKPQIVSSPSESFYDIVDIASSVSMLSVSSFGGIEKKKTFANIGNREKSLSRVVSDRPHSSNSEYEINVLHYEDDVPSGSKFPHFAALHSNSLGTNWPPAENPRATKIQNDDENYGNKRNVAKSQHWKSWDANKTVCDIKYSWETADDWMLPSGRTRYNDPYGIQNFRRYGGKSRDCEIKYSWQVIGTGTQTSCSLLQGLLNNNDTEDRNPKSAFKVCGVKYSWQIIGIGTQASLHDRSDPDYWSGILLTPNKNYNEYNVSQIGNDEVNGAKLRDDAKYPERRLKRYVILNNQQTQTFAEKNVQADVNDFYAKYSWHNLIKRYL